MFDNYEIKEEILRIKLQNPDIEVERIAKKLTITMEETNYYLRELRKEGKIQNKLTKRKKENMEKTRELYNSGMGIENIADYLNVTRQTICNYLNELEKDGKIVKKREDGRGLKGSIKKKENKEKTKKMYNDGNGLTVEQIAEKLELTTQTIYIYLKELGYSFNTEDGKDALEGEGKTTKRGRKKKGSEQNKEIEEEIKEILKGTKYNKKASGKFTQYMLRCKKRLQEDNLDSGEIEIIEKVAERTNKYAHILLCIKVNMHFGKTQRAKFWANSNLNNEMLTEDQRKSLENVKNRIDLIVKTRDARRALKEGKNVREAAEYSGLTETEVVKLKNKLEAKDKDKEPGDSTDEGR